MKVGDYVIVTEIESSDKESTDLNVGDTGVIVEEFLRNCGDELDGYWIKLDRELDVFGTNYNYRVKDGAYGLWSYQIEVVSELLREKCGRNR